MVQPLFPFESFFFCSTWLLAPFSFPRPLPSTSGFHPTLSSSFVILGLLAGSLSSSHNWLLLPSHGSSSGRNSNKRMLIILCKRPSSDMSWSFSFSSGCWYAFTPYLVSAISSWIPHFVSL